jgi:hypothetical protein
MDLVAIRSKIRCETIAEEGYGNLLEENTRTLALTMTMPILELLAKKSITN